VKRTGTGRIEEIDRSTHFFHTIALLWQHVWHPGDFDRDAKLLYDGM
jgi:hypothetical protein